MIVTYFTEKSVQKIMFGPKDWLSWILGSQAYDLRLFLPLTLSVFFASG